MGRSNHFTWRSDWKLLRCIFHSTIQLLMKLLTALAPITAQWEILSITGCQLNFEVFPFYSKNRNTVNFFFILQSTGIQALPSQFGHRVAIGQFDKLSLKSRSHHLLSLPTELIFLSLKIIELVRYGCPYKPRFAVLEHPGLFYLVVGSRRIFPIIFPESEVGFSGLYFYGSSSLTFGDRCDIFLF